MKLIVPTPVTDSILISSTIPETDYAEWSSVTTYALGQRVITAATHRVYEALAASTNKPPAANPTLWLDVGATNRWRAFDEKVGTVSSATTSMTYVLKAGVVTGIALFNVSATTATVTMTDPVDGVVFTETYDLLDSSGVLDWYSYFFSEIRYKQTLLIEGLPSYLNASITITLTGVTGATVSLGTCVIGRLLAYAPAANYGASIGIQDFSKKSQDQWGNWEIVERPYSKRAQFSFTIPNASIDAVFNTLSGLRATPAVYIGTGLYGAGAVLGFFKDFGIVIRYALESEVSAEIEGLV